MIVYRNHRKSVSPHESINRLRYQLTALRNSHDYAHAVALLIECGELETGVTDVICKNSDFLTPEVKTCHEITSLAGKIVCQLWESATYDRELIFRVEGYLGKLCTMNIPDKIPLSIPEGFVYYGLYPEMYIAAADNFQKENGPRSVIVLGLRSIGTTLAALVAAKLFFSGISVESFTIRPKGHPFNRFVEIDRSLKKIITADANSYMLVVDEGPGLSGSSIAGVIKKLREYGVEEKRIVIFPSWLPDGSRFISPLAKDLWKRHEKYTGDFEQQWIHSGRLEHDFGMKISRDISAGTWRYMLYKEENEFPGIHPHHERRKYLLRKRGDYTKYSMAKFVGLGRYGQELAKRACLLGESGMTPAFQRLVSGFALLDFVEGSPLKAGQVDTVLIETAARYCTFINKQFPTEPTASHGQMVEMVTENIGEGLGQQWLGKLSHFYQNFTRSLYEERIVAIDGRMMPHEWIRTEHGIMKVDHLEHHTDQFFHGPQNIAWDIAGFCIECEIDRTMQERLLSLYSDMSGDVAVYKRLHLYKIAYCAFRLGYVTLAADSLQGDPDAFRYGVLLEKYKKALEDILQV